MVVALFGESCTGKSTVARIISKKNDAQIYTGKDYLKLAKNEAQAKKIFERLLENMQKGKDSVIYVITEKDDLKLLPLNTYRVLFESNIDSIKERFAKRMNGNLPAPVAVMLERKHGLFSDCSYNLRVSTDAEDAETIACRIIEKLGDDTLSL